MIILVNKNMQMIWAQSIDLAAGPDAIADIRLDTDGQIIGVGNAPTSAIQCFAFKMNASNGQLIWKSLLNSPLNSSFSRIIEKGDGSGNYLLFGQTDAAINGGTGCDALLAEINRNTGAMVWDKHYTLGSCEAFFDVFLQNDQIVACGRYNLATGGQAGFRAALTRLDLAGNVQWSRHYLRALNQTARLYATSMTPDDDNIVLFGWGSDASTSLTATNLQLMKTDSAGALLWAKAYDIIGGNEERSFKLLRVNDGYLMFGTFVRPNASGREISLIKTSKDGAVMWGASFGALGEDRVNDVVLVSDTLFLIGSTTNGAQTDILIGKLDLNGLVEGDCNFAQPLIVSANDYPNPLDDNHNLTELDVTHNYAPTSLPVPTPEIVVTEVICQKVCETTCDDPDVSVTIDSLYCNAGSTVIKLRLYNTGFAQYPANSFLSFYDADPTLSAANLLRTMPIAFPVDTGTGLSVEIYDGHTFLPANTSFVLYAVANDDGSLNTPFSPGSFPQTGIEECDYTNNTDSRPFSGSGAPALDLGPNIATCPGAGFLIPANQDYFQYLWQDGSTDFYFTATASGTYWLETTDVCGFKQTDSISLTFLPFKERTVILPICPGDSVLVAGAYYTQPGTVLDTVAVPGSGCDSLITYQLQGPPASVLTLQCPTDVTVEAEAGAGIAVVDYGAPTAASDCICGDAAIGLIQGPASGSDFLLGPTQVCFAATDDCGSAHSCCFTVTVQSAPPPEDACDVKNISCLKFEILGIYQNPAQQKTYRMRVTNSCANELVHTTFQLPGGITADFPANNSTYTAPSGRQYEVRNPNISPEHSIRFKTVGDGIANGESDVFEYTLPPQANPLFIHATARLDPQVYYEVHLNVFDCEVQPIPARAPGSEARNTEVVRMSGDLTLYPNPASDLLFVQIPEWQDRKGRIQVTDALGRLLIDQSVSLEAGLTSIELPGHLSAGLFYLTVTNELGDRRNGRFVRTVQR